MLTDRVARLLLDGTDPQTILCLTYTKAAAAEMQNRLFRRLGAWAMKGDAELRGRARGAGPRRRAASLDDEALRAGADASSPRRIETPGGLKIQTIHAFCAGAPAALPARGRRQPRLPRARRPRGAALLRAEVGEAMAAGPLAPLVDAVAAHVTGDWDKVLLEIAGAREAFDGPCPEAELRARSSGCRPGSTATGSPRAIGAAERAAAAGATSRDACRTGKGKGDADAVVALGPLCGDGRARPRHIEALEGLLLYKSRRAAGPRAKAGAGRHQAGARRASRPDGGGWPRSLPRSPRPARPASPSPP